MNRDRLIDFLAKKTNLDDNNIKSFLDTFEMNLSVIYRNLYEYKGKSRCHR